MRNRISGYVVMGGFNTPDTTMVLRGTLCFPGHRATIFSTRRRAQRAIRLTIRDRIQLFGKNDLKFKIVACELEQAAK